MSQKTPMQVQLEELNKQQALLLQAKNKGTATPDQLKQLAEIEIEIADLKSDIEALAAPAASTTTTEAPAASTTTTEAPVIGYKVAENEKHLVHALVKKGVRFDPETGKEISAPYVQKFSVPEFKQVSSMQVALGLTLEVLYSPEK